MKRKNNGDGCVYQMSETKWGARIYLGKKEDGKPDTKSFSGKTEAIVKRKLKEFKKQRGLFQNIKESGIILEEYILNWLQKYCKLKLKPSSYDRIKSTIRAHVIPNLGFIQFATVTHDDGKVLYKN